MSTVVYMGTEVPDKNLKVLLKFKAFLSKQQQEEVISQIVETLNNPEDINKYDISMHVNVELREYKEGKDKKSFYYNKNDT